MSLKPSLADSMATTFRAPYRWLANKYYVDEAYDATVVEPLVHGSRSVLWRGVDVGLIDGIVNGVGRWSRADWRRPPAAAIRIHPELRGLGGARLHRGDHCDDGSSEAAR